MTQRHALVLASQSPRRRDILEQLGLRFTVEPSGVPEDDPGALSAAELAVALAVSKAEAVCRARESDAERPFVLGADTIVVVDGRMLGKPSDDAEAITMLTALAGREHEVVTGVALRRAGERYADEQMTLTRVRFRGLDADAVRRYVASGEGRDKAGAYAAQGLGAGLIAEIRGSYTNVVGLPAAETLGMLVRAGVLDGWP